jgi:hypothetical protein
MENPPTWMAVPPRNGEKHYKTVEGKDYIIHLRQPFCSTYNM